MKVVDVMKKRIISGFFIILILVLGLCYSKVSFAILISLCALIANYELISLNKDNKKFQIIRIISYIMMLLITLNNIVYKLDIVSIYILLIISLVVPLIIYNNKDYNVSNCLFLIGSIILIGTSFNSLILFRYENIYLCIYIFLISFITDTYAYIGGMLIGRHKLTSISEKKTIEGSIIGTIMATIIGSCYYNIAFNSYSMLLIILISLLLSIISQFGDLFFSCIKRYFNKKDYSNLIPGHGGILDRFDSVIFVTLLLKLIISIVEGGI